jgi:hypothetical protein
LSSLDSTENASNQVTLTSRPDLLSSKRRSDFFPHFWANTGWGLGLAVITKRDAVASVPGRVGWDGGYGTSWYSDPKRESRRDPHDATRLGRADRAGGPARLLTTTYAAIED